MDFFLRRLAHELRTPLASLRMLRELLASRPALNEDPKAADYLSRLDETIRDLVVLVDQVESLGAAQEDAEGPVFMPLAEFLVRLQGWLPGRASLRAEFPPEESPQESRPLDGRWFSHVLQPVLEAALLASEDGPVEVTVTKDLKTGLRITVRDSGPPPQGVEGFFEPFAHTDPRTRRARGGRSLRLCAAERWAARWGGQLTIEAVEATPDAPDFPRGARFTLRLPLHRPGSPAPPAPDGGC